MGQSARSTLPQHGCTLRSERPLLRRGVAARRKMSPKTMGKNAMLRGNADPPVEERRRFAPMKVVRRRADGASVRTESLEHGNATRNRFLASLSLADLGPLAGCAHDVPTTVVYGNGKP